MNTVRDWWHKLPPSARNMIDRVGWTAVQAFLATVLVADWHDPVSLRNTLIAGVAAAITAIKVLVQTMLAAARNRSEGVVITDPVAKDLSQTELQEAVPDHPDHPDVQLTDTGQPEN